MRKVMSGLECPKRLLRRRVRFRDIGPKYPRPPAHGRQGLECAGRAARRRRAASCRGAEQQARSDTDTLGAASGLVPRALTSIQVGETVFFLAMT